MKPIQKQKFPRILVISGPTASGKSALALELAEKLDGEIVCVDSLTVYRGLNIGSAKPTNEERSRVPHHLLDICDPHEPFTAADFRRAAMLAIADIISRGKKPILAGGTGLYLRVLLGGLADAPGQNLKLREQYTLRAEQEGPEVLLEELRSLDPKTAAAVHPNNLVRIIRALEVYYSSGVPLSAHQDKHQFSQHPYIAMQYLLNPPRDILYQRIESRVDKMLQSGLIDEYRNLLLSGVPKEVKPLCAIGYKEVAAFLEGRLNEGELSLLIKQNTRHYAKRQITWFRREAEMLPVAYPFNSATMAREVEIFFSQGE